MGVEISRRDILRKTFTVFAGFAVGHAINSVRIGIEADNLKKKMDIRKSELIESQNDNHALTIDQAHSPFVVAKPITTPTPQQLITETSMKGELADLQIEYSKIEDQFEETATAMISSVEVAAIPATILFFTGEKESATQ